MEERKNKEVDESEIVFASSLFLLSPLFKFSPKLVVRVDAFELLLLLLLVEELASAERARRREREEARSSANAADDADDDASTPPPFAVASRRI